MSASLQALIAAAAPTTASIAITICAIRSESASIILSSTEATPLP